MLIVFRKDFLKCVFTCISSKKACAFGFRVIISVSDHHARIFFRDKNLSFLKLQAMKQLYLNTTKIDE